jgi:predicted PurR-regulated permease PerM
MGTGNNFDSNSDSRSIDLTIKLLLIVILLVWCGMIILPFLVPVMWGAILAITLFPLYKKLKKLFRGKRVLASSTVTLLLLLFLIIPSVFLISSVVQSAGQLIDSLHQHTLVIPPPKESIAGWPVIGKPIFNIWLAATTNLEALITKYSDQIIIIGEKLAGALKSVASNLLMLILSIVISGIFLARSEKSEKTALTFSKRLGGKSGEELINVIVLTTRNVAKGILGVAFIQFILMGAAFILAGIPFAGLWAVLVLLFAIVQLPGALVSIPVIIYLYTAREPLPATLWSALILILGLSDNILKPWLMGIGAPVPMLVIFIGAIGGMILSGFIGLFTGAIILSIGYKLVMIWMEERAAD